MNDTRKRQLLLDFPFFALAVKTYVRFAPDEADRKLKDILLERYMQIHGREITVEKIRKAEPEWTRICKSIGISRSTRGVLPQKPPAGTVFVKDPEPLSSFKEGMLVMQHDTMEKILALGFMP